MKEQRMRINIIRMLSLFFMGHENCQSVTALKKEYSAHLEYKLPLDDVFLLLKQKNSSIKSFKQLLDSIRLMDKTHPAQIKFAEMLKAEVYDRLSESPIIENKSPPRRTLF